MFAIWLCKYPMVQFPSVSERCPMHVFIATDTNDKWSIYVIKSSALWFTETQDFEACGSGGEVAHHRRGGTGARESAAYRQLYPTQSSVWLQITCQSCHSACQLAWLASSSQSKWAHSAASWQSRASDKRMVQTWHTFKKFSLPFPNPLHCKWGWHVPNEIEAFVSENSPPLSGIVSSKTTRSHSWGKMLFRGMLCYSSSYVIFREAFICEAFAQPLVLFDADGSDAFSKDSALKMTEWRLRWNENGTGDPYFLDLFPGSWPYFWYVIYGGLEFMPVRDSSTATGNMQGCREEDNGEHHIYAYLSKGRGRDMANIRSYNYGHGENMIRQSI